VTGPARPGVRGLPGARGGPEDYQESTLTMARPEIRQVADAVLDVSAAAVGGNGDAGPAMLATAVAMRDASGETAARALVAWLRQLRFPSHAGLLSGGTAGRLLALRIAASTWPRLDGLAGVLRSRLCAHIAGRPWAVSDVGWADYDLVTGAAGTLLAFAADPAVDPADCDAVITYLTTLCARDDLAGLRAGRYRDDKQRQWNQGRINLGLAHGLPGVVAALSAAADADGLIPVLDQALRRLAGLLLAESFTDSRGVLTWPLAVSGAATVGAPVAVSWPSATDSVGRLTDGRRQAWCYGSPGIAWPLWEAGRVLGEPDIQAVAAQAATSFIAAYEDDFYLYPARDRRERLAICHGAAGLLVIFDAFARHADLEGAAALRDHLLTYLSDRLEAVAELARTDCSLQSGASGVVLALLTAAGGDRRWLTAIGLR
jgi:hypothetical protein